MRVWVITTGEPLPVDKGSVRLFRSGALCQEMGSRGHQVIWWTSGFNHALKVQRDFGAEVRLDANQELRFLGGVSYSKNVSLKRILNHLQISKELKSQMANDPMPDLVVVSYPVVDLAYEAVKYCHENDIPCIVDVRDLWPDAIVELFPPRYRWLARALTLPIARKAKFVFKNATAMSGITKGYLNWGLRWADRAESSLDRVFPLTSDPSNYSHDEETAASEKWDKLGVVRTEDCFLVVFVGVLSNRKFCLDTVMAAVEMVLETGAKFKFVFCGTGDDRAEFESRYAQDKILFPGWIGGAELKSLLLRANLALAPYRSTAHFELSTPIKMYDYLAAGLPILTSLKGEVADLVEDEHIGAFFGENDAIELKRQLIEIERDRDLHEGMRLNAQSLFDTRFRPKAVYIQMADHFEKIISH